MKYDDAFVLESCDGTFTKEVLNAVGNSFAESYYDSEDAQYLDDYGETLGQGTPDGPYGLYYVSDSWENFDKLKPVLDRRYADWRNSRL